MQLLSQTSMLYDSTKSLALLNWEQSPKVFSWKTVLMKILFLIIVYCNFEEGNLEAFNQWDHWSVSFSASYHVSKVAKIASNNPLFHASAMNPSPNRSLRQTVVARRMASAGNNSLFGLYSGGACFIQWYNGVTALMVDDEYWFRLRADFPSFLHHALKPLPGYTGRSLLALLGLLRWWKHIFTHHKVCITSLSVRAPTSW